MEVYSLSFLLFDFAYCPEFYQKVNALADITNEKWSFSEKRKNFILVNYINHTFEKLISDLSAEKNPTKKDSIFFIRKGNAACFNTGLFDREYQTLYGYFRPNRYGGRQEWVFEGFFTKYQISRLIASIKKFPQRAHYFKNLEDLVFNTNFDIVPQYEHIFGDEKNLKRIPEKIRCSPVRQFLFDSAVKYAKYRIEANYRTAVPQYYNGKIQLLIPICFMDYKKADLAMVVEKKGELQKYFGHTCLTLEMAYNNSRLIARPESNWLKTNSGSENGMDA